MMDGYEMMNEIPIFYKINSQVYAMQINNS